MKNDLFFSEVQKFKQWWLWLILLTVTSISTYGIFKKIGFGDSIPSKLLADLSILIPIGIMILVIILFLTIKLETEIRRDGVYVRFFPLQRKFIHYSWDEISYSYVREYNAILEFGGWGYRLGFLRKGRALNISGNKGLQLEFYDKRKLLIGTKLPDELTNALINLNKLKQ